MYIERLQGRLVLPLRDIGKHFPDTDPQYKGISSIKLLQKAGCLLEEHCFLIENIDATIIAQAPKMRPYIDNMRENIANALGIEIGQVNIKATTEEGLGFTGQGEGCGNPNNIKGGNTCFLNGHFIRGKMYHGNDLFRRLSQKYCLLYRILLQKLCLHNMIII